MKKIILLFTALLFCIQLFSSPGTSAREIHYREKPRVLNINFNGETIKGYYLLLDFRTAEEKRRDRERASLSGDVIIFLHGHAQRPNDAYSLTANLALLSKSGIVIIPVCDTPYGADKNFRGDRGKEVILMHIIRFALLNMDIKIEEFTPKTGMKIKITSTSVTKTSGHNNAVINAKSTLIGWSHGALLARRLAHSYPESVNSLVQMAPAGYKEWGSNSCAKTACLSTSFTAESMRIGFGIFRGQTKEIFGSGCGIIKGVSGDTMRSCSSCLSGYFNPLKLFRANRDTAETAVLATDDNFPLPQIQNITVIFASWDGLFRADDLGGIENRSMPSQQEIEVFFQKYYPSSVKSGAVLNLMALPGNH
ncbi:MAG: hypothetical protein ACOCWZ_11750, partial [Spirochaetota bacterium]